MNNLIFASLLSYFWKDDKVQNLDVSVSYDTTEF